MSNRRVWLAAIVLFLGLTVCSYAAYAGWGVAPIGPQQLREESVFGPGVRGGGPGTGK